MALDLETLIRDALTKHVPDADLRELARHAVGAVRLAFDRALAHEQDAQRFPLPTDPASLERAFAARCSPTVGAGRLLIVGTYRPREALEHGHPLRLMVSELRLHRQCQELRLTSWSPAGVAAYLHQRFGGKSCPPALALFLHQRTQGNPMFVVTVVDDAVRRGILREGTTDVMIAGGVEAVAADVQEAKALLEALRD